MKLIFAMAAPTDEKVKELRDKLCDLNERAQVIQACADSESRMLKEEETKELETIFKAFDSIEEEIARRELIAEQTSKLTKTQGRMAEVQQPAAVNSSPIIDPAQSKQPRRVANLNFQENRGQWGWRSMGEFAMKVREASAKNATQIDPRLVMNAPSTYSSEGVGSDGGYAVPPDFRTEIWEKVAGEDSLLSRTDQNPTSRNTIVFPADETTPWDSSGGIQAYFDSEAGAKSQSKIALREKTVRLNKLIALVPVTDELLEDAPGLDAYLRKKVGEKFDFKLNLKFVQGSGAGEPLGILKAPSLVSVTKESGQSPDTIVADNIMKIWRAMYAPCRRNAVWLINQDIEAQLMRMAFTILNASGAVVSGVPIYMPANGLSDTPYATLLGRPVIPTQACSTLGDQGDIILVDLKQYMTAFKSGLVKTDISMHLWFDYDVSAYRFVLRITGQPWWATYITPLAGTNYMSWAVTLDERT